MIICFEMVLHHSMHPNKESGIVPNTITVQPYNIIDDQREIGWKELKHGFSYHMMSKTTIQLQTKDTTTNQ